MNKNVKKKKSMTTFDIFMQNPEQKKKYDKEYNTFLLSEFLLEAMEKNQISVRKLAEKSGVAPSIIQNLKSEKTTNITFNTLNSILSTLGYRVSFKKIKNT